ncbi:uncharacterized protein LOC107005610 isoform X2 [Solanum pennellii]|uniref:Uncharacterized protein LOC107005610 isoform X2 n=1 Tax=Solanum pennellii TaxID=28526 RepID=A0ABM1V065_SOLPN|nr:uncharacterized protein LOC107005610 isoform X2 [Solanum pennellii]
MWFCMCNVYHSCSGYNLGVASKRCNFSINKNIQEVILDADLRCTHCQNRVSSVISNVEDVESIVVHVLEKKVTLIRKSTSK